MLEEKCSICGQLPVWNGKPLVLELDHIDGDHTNNELSNLRIVCGHCHSQTPNFRGRKPKKEKQKSRKKKTSLCSECHKKIYKDTKTGLCRECYQKVNLCKKIKNRPSQEQLLQDIEELGYRGTGRKYGVSDTTIKKWINRTSTVWVRIPP